MIMRPILILDIDGVIRAPLSKRVIKWGGEHLNPLVFAGLLKRYAQNSLNADDCEQLRPFFESSLYVELPLADGAPEAISILKEFADIRICSSGSISRKSDDMCMESLRAQVDNGLFGRDECIFLPPGSSKLGTYRMYKNSGRRVVVVDDTPEHGFEAVEAGCEFVGVGSDLGKMPAASKKFARLIDYALHVRDERGAL
ncbi:MAG: hypothetical protein LBO78_01610 [Rickettsiales bacterium]|jgi:hypothetical protein|nr:hypothetical protein [Rickettsiales bacterium]